MITAIAVSLSIPPSAHAQPLSSEPLITPDQARAWIETWWPRREQINLRNDVAAGRELEDGIASEIDVGISLDNQIRNLAGERVGRGAIAMNVIVPQQASYPASFLAEIFTVAALVSPDGSKRNGPYMEFVVVSRRSETADWKISFVTGYAVNELPNGLTRASESDFHLPVAPDNNGLAAPAFDIPWMNPRELRSSLAAYWQHWSNAKSAPAESPFAPGYWTTQRGEAIAESNHHNYRCKCIDTVRYFTSPHDDVWMFPLEDEQLASGAGNLVCSTVRYDITVRPKRHRYVLIQGKHRQNWGGFLPRGSYTSITDHYVRPVCALIDRVGPPVHVIAATTEKVDTTGRRARRSRR